MTLIHTFKGAGVALVTPFKSDLSVDYNAFESIIENIINQGCHFLVALGTTAETPCLTAQEKIEISKFVVKITKNRVPLMLGMGGNCTSELITQIKNTDLTGYQAILSVTPYYNKPSQEGLIMHYMQLADASPLPIVLYNVPGRTGINMTAKTSIQLAHHPNIIGLKEASGNMSQISELLLNKPADFLILSGDDGLCMSQMALGIDGVISVAANAFPKLFGQMARAAQANDLVALRKIHFRLIETIDLLFVEGNPTGIKAAMEIKALLKNELRLPLVKSSDELYQKLAYLIKEKDLN